MTPSPTNILVLHAGALGDCVLALHLIVAVKNLRGNPRVTVAARSSIVRWAQRHGLIDEARSLEESGLHTLYRSAGAVAEQTVQFLCGFDRIVSFLGGRSENITRRLEDVYGGEVFAIDPRPTPGLATHIVQQWADQLRGYGLALEVQSAPQLEMRDRRALHHRLCSRIGISTDKVILCHPGSGGLAKCCPLEALETLVARVKKLGWHPVWMMGPDEVERFGAQYRRRLEPTAPVLYEESIDVAADWVAGADAFIGNDAGMTHVAALAGVYTVALFGPTDPAVWRPLGSIVHVFELPGPCRSFEEWACLIVSQLDTFNSSARSRRP